MAEQKSKEEVIAASLKAHGFRENDVLASGVVDDRATLVTRGGQKIRWKLGDPPVTIPDHQRPRIPKKK